MDRYTMRKRIIATSLNKKRFLSGVFLTLLATVVNAQPFPYQQAGLPVSQRVDDLMKRMTLEEKVAMVHAQSNFSSAGCPRLGIPELWMSDGPHGVRAEVLWGNFDWANWTTDSCTAFPALTCLAASFNPDMAYAYG